jgi:hypothetical protein
MLEFLPGFVVDVVDVGVVSSFYVVLLIGLYYCR